MNTLFAILPNIGTTELIVIGIVALLLFGSRLPEVARSLGKSMTEFKRGMAGIEDEFRNAASTSSRPQVARHNDLDDRDEATAPKFEPPPAEPKAEKATADEVA